MNTNKLFIYFRSINYSGLVYLQIHPFTRYLFNDAVNLEDDWRMASSGMLRPVALVKTDVSAEPSASIIRVTRIGELGKTLAGISSQRALVAIYS
jgi:hypothetical protein